MKIDLITGSYPPMRCGVGDYTYLLSKALRKKGVEVEVYTSVHAKLLNKHAFLRPVVKKWSIWKVLPLSIKLRKASCNIVHIQYPTIGYGYHLGPQILLVLLRLIGIRVVTTVHEFQLARTLRRISLFPFFFWSNSLIFTSEEERMAMNNAYPSLNNKLRDETYVIPVGSNIPFINGHVPSQGRGKVASFFGLFYPGRRIELVISAFQKALERHPELKFRFIGDIHPRHREYFLMIKELAEKTLPLSRVEWVMGKTPEEIAVALEQSDVCVLPFPDGASFRRTTLIAALSLGIPTITTKGGSTPDDFVEGKNVLFADDENAIADAINRVLTDQKLSATLAEEGKLLSNRSSWDQIATGHIQVYEKLAK